MSKARRKSNVSDKKKKVAPSLDNINKLYKLQKRNLREELGVYLNQNLLSEDKPIPQL